MDRLPVTAAGHAALEDELSIAYGSSDRALFSGSSRRLLTIPTWLKIRNIKPPGQTRTSTRPVLPNLKTNSHVSK
jgi:hypothetical protein